MLAALPEAPRVLIVSANMGEGHNATGRALEEAVRNRWPDATVHWLDTLDVMGNGVGPVFRGIYFVNVRRTPWLYEFFYDSIVRYRWFARSSTRFVGAWAGRRLARHLGEFQPDLILSTYPLGTAALAWLRRFRALHTPIGAWVSDFSPHPFWVYRDIDLNLVMHDVAVDRAARWVPGAPLAVSAPPVTGRFAIGDQPDARAALDLPADALIALVSCGSLGFGSVESAAATLLAADPELVVVVACGRNEPLRQRLLADGTHGGRLHALGWTDRMAELTIASDVVVTNAGGATSLEALACGRPVLMYRPIAAHGRANAALMAEAGLAEVCADDAALTAAVRRMRAEPEHLAALANAATQHTGRRTIADGLENLLAAAENPPLRRPTKDAPARLRAKDAPARLRAEDALFVHVQTAEVPQQVGAVLVLDPKADGSPATLADAAYLVSAAPGLAGRIEPGSAWRHPRWVADSSITAERIVEPVDVGGPDSPHDLDDAMDAFFSVPLDETTGTARAQLVRGLDGGRSALLIKLHHAGADGIAVIGALVGRARGREFIIEPEPAESRPTRAERLTGVRDLVGGLWTLARTGRARPTELNGPVRSARRHHARVDLAAGEVRQMARALNARTADLATALLGEALHRVLHADGVRKGPEQFRLLMPRSTRTTRTFRSAGNHTGAATVEVPVGPMTFAERVARTKAATGRQVESSAPHAAHAVVRLLGALPPWLHAIASRWVYRSTWFNAIGSVLPGARSPVFLNGSRVAVVYPVLSLAPGVKLSVGIMTWADLVTLCFTGDADLAGRVDALADAVLAAFKEARTAITGTTP